MKEKARPGDAVTGVQETLRHHRHRRDEQTAQVAPERVIDGAVVADALFHVPLMYWEP
jgi:hypothetical protein